MVPRGRGGQATGNGFGRAAPSHAPDKNLWTHLINHLKKKDLLPVVCFVFSKKRCEENAASLGATDLCDAREKSMVHVTMERALKRLKGTHAALVLVIRSSVCIEG
jgi:antiviral helicase SKI2